MAGDLVLITGATGHIGFRVLRYALEYGYLVRAAVRSEAKANALKSNPVLKAMNKDSQLSFIVVPDIIAQGAYDEAVKDVKYILHIASPIPTGEPADGDYDKAFITPAVQGTIGMLESARRAGTVKRIVVTSSFVALAPPTMFSESIDEVFTAESRVPDFPGPYPNMMLAYVASKIAAFNRAEQWIASQSNLPFDVIHIHPSYVFGRDETATKTSDFYTGTNHIPLLIARGAYTTPEHPAAHQNSFNHVDDTARVHVLALDTDKVKGNQSFITNRDDFAWSDTGSIVANHFPEAVKSGVLAGVESSRKGTPSTIVTKVDARKTEETFGFVHRNYEGTVVDVVGHWLELYEKEKSGNGEEGNN